MGIKELGPLLKSIKFKSKKFSNLQKFLANNLKDSIITQEDLSANIRLDGGGNGVEGFQTNFTIDGKRSAIGLLAKPSKRNKIKKSLLFSLKDKIRKLQKDKCEEPTEKIRETVVLC